MSMERFIEMLLRCRAHLIILFLYPVYFLIPVFTGSGNAQMGQPYFGIFKATDVAGSIRNAWVLKSMDYPWSYEYVTNYPEGEFFWRWQNFTQFVQLIYTWLMTRFLSPSIVVASIILIGWVFTGYIIYRCALQLELAPLYALAAGFLWQILPWTKAKAATQTSFMFLGFLLLNLLLLSKKDVSKRKYLLQIFSLHLLVVLFDPYLFFMLLLIDLCFVIVVFHDKILFSYTKLRKSSRKKIILIRKFNFKITSLLVLGFIFSSIGTRLLLNSWSLSSQQESASRNLKITTKDEITPWLGSLGDYINPPAGHFFTKFYQIGSSSLLGEEFGPDLINYSGVFLVGFSLLGLVTLLKKNFSSNFARSLVFVTVVFLITTINFQVELFSTSVVIGPFADLLAPFMPGIRVFSRFGLLVQACLCIFAAKAISDIRGRTQGYVVPLLLTSLMVFDLSPWDGRGLSEENRQFKEFNRLIKLNSDESLIQLPLGGRAWIDQSFLFNDQTKFRTVNSLYSISLDGEMQRAIEGGEASFRKLLSELGVKYLIIAEGSPKLYDQSFTEPLLTSDYFIPLARTTVSGSEPGYRVNLKLYYFNRK